MIGDRIVDDDGTVLGTSGFYLDLTDALEEDLRAAVDAAMSSLADARAVIEQARVFSCWRTRSRPSDPPHISIERPARGYPKVESRPAPRRSLRALRCEESHDPGCGETLERPPHGP